MKNWNEKKGEEYEYRCRFEMIIIISLGVDVKRWRGMKNWIL